MSKNTKSIVACIAWGVFCGLVFNPPVTYILAGLGGILIAFLIHFTFKKE